MEAKEQLAHRTERTWENVCWRKTGASWKQRRDSRVHSVQVPGKGSVGGERLQNGNTLLGLTNFVVIMETRLLCYLQL